MSNFENIIALIISSIFIFFFLGFIIFCSPFDSELHHDLETICNQLHETNSCSLIYKNDNVVLFDTYNGYVTMENIFEK